MRPKLRMLWAAWLGAGSIFATSPADQQARRVLADLPIHFERNSGGPGDEVEFSARMAGYAVRLTRREAIVRPPSPAAEVRIRLEGSAASPEVEGVDRLPVRTDYFVGKRSQWRTGVEHFARVRYREVYPGTDVVFYGNGSQLEYDFLLRPGARPSRIRVQYGGARSLSLTPEGDLLIRAGSEVLVQKRPFVYQEDASGSRRQVRARYRLLGKRTVGFEVARYDASRTLVIDPVLVYSSLLGGTGNDAVMGVKMNSDGMLYVAGHVTDSELPGTAGAFRTAPAGATDLFVAKINPAATGAASLVYLTYIGGSGSETLSGMTVDREGNVYLTGSTNSTNFPLAGLAHQNRLAGETDAFVIKLSPFFEGDGALSYSSYLGGAKQDLGHAIDFDASGAIYVAGTTRSENFPTTPSAYAAVLWGLQDAFIAKINPAQEASLVYSSLLGGELADDGRGVVVAPSGQVYFVGATSSTMFPWGGIPGRLTLLGGLDIFVTVMDLTKPGTDSLLYMTYFGGTGGEEVRRAALDGQGRLLLTGYTLSPDFPVTEGALRATAGGRGDAFVARLDFSLLPGSPLEYATYLGGSDGDVAYDISSDRSGNILVTGYTLSPDFPVTPDAFQPRYSGGVDLFVTKFNPDSPSVSAIVYSTYLGQAAIHVGYGAAVAASGEIYVGGITNSRTLPESQNGLPTVFGGGLFDGFLAGLKPGS